MERSAGLAQGRSGFGVAAPDGRDSLHDAWLVGIHLSHRAKELVLEFLGSRHDRKLILRYSGLAAYRVDLDVTFRAGDRDVLVHEFRIEGALVCHEIAFQQGRSILVTSQSDDTLVRSVGAKSIPIPGVVEQVKKLASAGAELYCWSTVGADYARSATRELGIESCFVGFLPKPNILIDDQAIADWKRFATVHPLNASGKSVDEYQALLDWGQPRHP